MKKKIGTMRKKINKSSFFVDKPFFWVYDLIILEIREIVEECE